MHLSPREQEKLLVVRAQELSISISKRQSDQKARYLQAEATVQNITLDLLRRDLPLEESFAAPQAPPTRQASIKPTGP